MCEDVGVIHLPYVRCILSQHSHPGPYWLHLHRLQGKCWQVLPKETYNSISGFPALFPFLQDLPGQGIKDRIHQPQWAVQLEYFASWNSLRSADDLPSNSCRVTREMYIKQGLGNLDLLWGESCLFTGRSRRTPAQCPKPPTCLPLIRKNISKTAQPLIQILLETGWKLGNYPDVLSHLSRMDSLEKNQNLNNWEIFIPFLSSDRLSQQAESWEFRSVHPWPD